MTLARRTMTELQTYADLDVSALDVERAWQDFRARVEKRSATRQRIRRAAVVTATVAVVMALIVGTRWPTMRENRPAPPAEHSKTMAPNRSYYLDVATGRTTPIAESLIPRFARAGSHLPLPLYSPTGTKLALTVYLDTCHKGRCGPEMRLVVENADGSGATAFPNRYPYPLAWSPDGRHLLYQGTSAGSACSSCAIGNLYLLDVESGSTRQLTKFRVSNGWWWQLHADISPDGRTVIFDLPRGSDFDTRFDVWSVPVEGGTPSLVLRDAGMPRYLADGEHIVFLQPARGFTGDVISIAGPRGELETLAKSSGTWFLAMSPERTRLLYPTDGGTHVVDIATGQDRHFPTGYRQAAWVNDDTLIVVP